MTTKMKNEAWGGDKIKNTSTNFITNYFSSLQNSKAICIIKWISITQMAKTSKLNSEKLETNTKYSSFKQQAIIFSSLLSYVITFSL